VSIESNGWVRETHLGTWFQNTRIWTDYVLRPAVEDLERLLADRRAGYPAILDVGCGGGHDFPLLEHHFRPETLFGVDIDPHLIEQARSAGQRSTCRTEVAEGDAGKLEFADDSLDMVFCHQTLHHVSDQSRALAEFHRVLKPGGVLLIAESCRPFTRSLWVQVLFRHPTDVQRSADGYLELLRASGFSFDGASVSTPDPFWSRPDFGLREWLGRPARRAGEPRLVYVSAVTTMVS
jgi:SAM-dependent methyltransferase